jgi:hypothetical protein
MRQYKRHFSINEARGYLSRLRYEISEIRRLASLLDKVGFDVYRRKYRVGYHPDTLNEFPDEFMQLMDTIDDLHKEGIIIKGIEEGLVDFPALRDNGEEVFLCWKDGEEDIEHWHSIDAGFRGRRPLDEF